jgi:hypothetical protein
MELRSELMPPKLEEAKVAKLAKLASSIDGSVRSACEEEVDEFNVLAGTNEEWLMFQGISGGTSHETWVR